MRDSQLIVVPGQGHQLTELETRIAAPQPTALQVIAEAARDPKVDIDKLAALLGMQERLEARDAEREFNRDFAAAMLEMPTIGKLGVKDMGDKGKIPYAKYEDVDRAVRPVEAKYGFARSFRTAPGENGILLTLVLTHKAGHSISSTRLMPADPGPGRNAIQAQGSGESYGRRYATLSMWNLITENIDDDATKAGAISDSQVEQIMDMLSQISTKETFEEQKSKFLKFVCAKTIREIQQPVFKIAINQLEAKRKAMNK